MVQYTQPSRDVTGENVPRPALTCLPSGSRISHLPLFPHLCLLSSSADSETLQPQEDRRYKRKFFSKHSGLRRKLWSEVLLKSYVQFFPLCFGGKSAARMMFYDACCSSSKQSVRSSNQCHL